MHLRMRRATPWGWGHAPGNSVLYIRLKETYDPPLGKLGLEALTKCPIINYVRITGTAYKTKVHT